FFISTEGYLMTNCHLVESAKKITVTLYDGSEYTATLVGKDSLNDVAVLKVEMDKEPSILKIGSSADMVVGEDVLIIGNPLGELTYTMTRGIVSNLSRDIMTDQSTSTIRMFQTDAAINNGNSGGPALDCHGNVIGIASAKYASSSIEGICFCIPIDDAMEVANDLIREGHVTGRPYLGVNNLQAVSGYAGSQYIAGVRVGGVVSGSCAEKAGVQAGDIVTEIGSTAVTSSAGLRGTLAKYKAGDEITIKVFRNSEYVLITVVLDEAPADTE
ncbi:MAG: trypsin-like peptidase domain-containing protein, partial [Clostridia bacterium]|nr:trypsin-like peptidase domain-containing protein [Clostridia bacterium]